MGNHLRILGLFFALLTGFTVSGAKTVGCDTILTIRGDKIELGYSVEEDNGMVTVDISSARPHIINPSYELKEECGGETKRLKIVAFDRIGNFGKTKWKGMTPSAFVVPSGLTYKKSPEGSLILGECGPLEFEGTPEVGSYLEIPVYIAVYEKKQHYRILQSRKASIRIPLKKQRSKTTAKVNKGETRKETIAVTSTIEASADNADLNAALASMQLVSEMIERETEVPFSQALSGEIFNLRGLKNRISDPEVVSRINALLLRCDDRERELKEESRLNDLASKSEEAAKIEKEKQESLNREKKAEEEARLREEKQQKRTIWMIIGGIILAIMSFIGNTLFKNFRDLRNQRNLMKMQESLTKEAQGEATRRAREVVRNRAHQAANNGRSKMREIASGKKKSETAKKERNKSTNPPRSI